jgi:hypothetical protein
MNQDQIIFALRVGWRLRRWHKKWGALLEEDGGRGRRSFDVPADTIDAMVKAKVLKAEQSSRDEARKYTDFVLRVDSLQSELFK